MALILEVRDSKGVATLYRLEGQNLALGRALSNDIILDDPYVDAHHARIAVTESGNLELLDCDSMNGVRVEDVRVQGAVPIAAGVSVRLGRSTLRFRDVNEAVAPALLDTPNILAAPTPQRSLIPASKKWQWAILAATALVFLLNGWLGSTSRDGWTPAISGTLGAFTALAIWSVLWGASTRASGRKLNFVRHLTVVCAAVLTSALLYFANSWSQFLFPGVEALEVFIAIAYCLVFAACIAEQLAVSTSMSAVRRWRAGGLVAGFLVLTLTLAAKSRLDKQPHDEASIEASLKPLDDRFVPSMTVPNFTAELTSLRADVDKLLEE